MAVSAADVEHIRRTFAAFNERFATINEGGGVDRFFTEFYAPEGVVENVDNFPVPGRYAGLDGYREFVSQSYGSYRDVTWRVESIEPIGERVVVLARISGKPPDDDVELEVALGVTYEMSDGKIAYSRVYVGHDRARDAARNGG